MGRSGGQPRDHAKHATALDALLAELLSTELTAAEFNAIRVGNSLDDAWGTIRDAENDQHVRAAPLLIDILEVIESKFATATIKSFRAWAAAPPSSPVAGAPARPALAGDGEAVLKTLIALFDDLEDDKKKPKDAEVVSKAITTAKDVTTAFASSPLATGSTAADLELAGRNRAGEEEQVACEKVPRHTDRASQRRLAISACTFPRRRDRRRTCLGTCRDDGFRANERSHSTRGLRTRSARGARRRGSRDANEDARTGAVA